MTAGGRRAHDPRRAADGVLGRVVTWPAPDAFVLVEGVLLRATPQGEGVRPGAGVRLRLDPDGRRLLALAARPEPGE
ncbi:hypothetical protein [Streptomyces chisholmiae]|uniref:hypothetical protein n=1 Tax=Streptomyces chisholmiae TaxID=3075540 RepID=UPI0028896EE9|nr:hypothetical protein [Streptomyces sp. DSM 44915]